MKLKMIRKTNRFYFS